MTARFIVGDALTVLRALPDASVDLVLSSPPYLALRSYLPADDPAKTHEMGSEATPGEFIDALLEVTEECRRVLAPHGTLCFELGDTYAGSGGAGGDYMAEGLRDGQERFDGSGRRRRMKGAGRDWPQTEGANWKGERPGWPFDKSLALIPESFRWALAYGRNPFTGRETPRWRVRNVVRHFRPNPPVGALGDKFRPATSEWVVACGGRSRYFDLDAVRVPASPNTHPRVAGNGTRYDLPSQQRDGNWNTLAATNVANPAGAPPLDWWADDYELVDSFVAPTFGYPGAHYATFSPKVVARFIEAMCPAKVCRECGEPSRRVVDATRTLDGIPADLPPLSRSERAGAEADGIGHWRKGTTYTTTGWTDCGHAAYRPGVVLDPFAGSGTTLAVATGHSRDAIGIDLDARNADLALERVGMFLEVVTTEPAA